MNRTIGLLITAKLLFMTMAACDKKNHLEPSQQSHKYLVLIGQGFSPNYNELSTGKHYDISETQIMAKSVRAFGTLNVFWNGTLEQTYSGPGGIFMRRPTGVLTLTGELESDLRLVVLKQIKSNEVILVQKRVIPKSEELSLKIDIGKED